MLVTRELVERLEQAETETVVRLVRSLARTAVDPVPEVHRFGTGVLAATGPGRYVNRAVGVTLGPLDGDDVDTLVRWYARRRLPAAVQLSPWAPGTTVRALADRGFVPVSCRSVLVRPTVLDVCPQGPGSFGTPPSEGVTIEVVPVEEASAGAARDVMAAETGHDRATSDEFMTADRSSDGTTQLLALLDGVPVGCGSVTVVDRTAWLGAAATVPAARRRGVQAALVAHRTRLAREAGCDMVGATATVGSVSARNLQRLGFVTVQEQWVVQRR